MSSWKVRLPFSLTASLSELSPGKRGRRSLGPRTRPWIEHLEDRTVPATFDVTGTAAAYLAGGYVVNQVTVAVVTGKLQLADPSETITLTPNAVAAGCLSVDVHTIRCPLASLSSLDINTIDRLDTVTIKPLGLTVTTTVRNSANYSDVVIDDQVDTANRTVALDGSTLTGLSATPIILSAGSINSLIIKGGSGTNQFSLSDTPTTFAVAGTTLSTGSGANSVQVEATATGSLNIQGHGGNDTVILGNSFTGLGSVNATVAVSNTTPTTDLTCDDSQDLTARTATLTATAVSGLSPFPINFLSASVHSLTIKGSNGGNNFTIQDTPGNAVKPLTTLFVGTTRNVVDIQATTGPLTVIGQGGRDRVQIGQWRPSLFIPGTTNPPVVSAIRGQVAITNNSSVTDLTVDDSGDPNPRRGISLTASTLSKLAPADITFSPRALSSLTIKAGSSGRNVFNVTDASTTGYTTTLVTGNGDTVKVVKATGTLIVQDATANAVFTAGNAPFLQHIISRGGLALSPATNFSSTIQGIISNSSDINEYSFSISKSIDAGHLSVEMTPIGSTPLNGRVSLWNVPSYVVVDGSGFVGGGLLAGSVANPLYQGVPHIDQYILPGDYTVRVAGLNGGLGSYRLTVTFVPDKSIPNATNPYAIDAIANSNDVGANPQDLVAADFNRDSVVDLATVNADSDNISVLLGVGDGGFQAQYLVPLYPGEHPTRIAAIDYNHDGRVDVATLDSTTGMVTILIGIGDGTFLYNNPIRLPAVTAQADPQFQLLFDTSNRDRIEPVSHLPSRFVNGDFNRNGYTIPNDIGAFLDPIPGTSKFYDKLLISLGVPAFPSLVIDQPSVTNYIGGPVPAAKFTVPPGSLLDTTDRFPSDPPQATPMLADVTGDGIADVLEVDLSGRILLRTGQIGSPGVFTPYVVINDVLHGGHPARQLAVLLTGQNAQIAALRLGDQQGQGDLVDIYTRDPITTAWRITQTMPTGFLPLRIAAGDLQGSGLNDFVLADAQTGILNIYINQRDGTYRRGPDVKADVFVSDLQLIDLNGDGRLDIVCSEIDSGNVGVFLNLGLAQGSVGFSSETRYRAGTPDRGFGEIHPDFSSLVNGYITQHYSAAAMAIPSFPNFFPELYFDYSSLNTAATTLGYFRGTGTLDMVTVNRVENSINFLRGRGDGTFDDPSAGIPTGAGPGAVVAGVFETNGHLDLAVLNEVDHTVWVYTGDGTGNFTHAFSIDVGLSPTGLSVVDLGNGHLDLLVGNTFGDLLVLYGKGDGTFTPLESETAVPFALGDFSNSGVSRDALLANQAASQVDQIVRQGSTTQLTTTATQNQSNGVQLPGDVIRVDTLGSNFGVVAMTGGNQIRVYRRQASGALDFANPSVYNVGTNPVGIMVFYTSGSSSPSLAVANSGSNDVSILFGQGAGSNWSLLAGPRIKAGQDPIAVAFRDTNGDGIPDLVATNGQSNQLTIVPGLSSAGQGSGFFDDQHPTTVTLSTSTTPLTQGIVQVNPPPASPPAATPSPSFIADGRSILQLDPTLNSMQSVFTAGARVSYLEADQLIGNTTPSLFAVVGSQVEQLTSGSNGSFREQVLDTPGVNSPSQLHLLQTGLNQFDLYVSDSLTGKLFVFSYNETETGLPQSPPSEADPGSQGSPVDTSSIPILTFSPSAGSPSGLVPASSLLPVSQLVSNQTSSLASLDETNLVFVASLLAGSLDVQTTTTTADNEQLVAQNASRSNGVLARQSSIDSTTRSGGDDETDDVQTPITEPDVVNFTNPALDLERGKQLSPTMSLDDLLSRSRAPAESRLSHNETASLSTVRPLQAALDSHELASWFASLGELSRITSPTNSAPWVATDPLTNRWSDQLGNLTWHEDLCETNRFVDLVLSQAAAALDFFDVELTQADHGKLAAHQSTWPERPGQQIFLGDIVKTYDITEVYDRNCSLETATVCQQFAQLFALVVPAGLFNLIEDRIDAERRFRETFASHPTVRNG